MINRLLKKSEWTPEEAAEMLMIREEMHQRDQKAYEDKVLAKGRKAGIKESREKGKAKMINMFIKNGMNIDEISKCTGLLFQEIKKLLAKYSC